MSRVTGPSFTCLICIMAPNPPVAMCRPRAAGQFGGEMVIEGAGQFGARGGVERRAGALDADENQEAALDLPGNPGVTGDKIASLLDFPERKLASGKADGLNEAHL